MFECCSFQFRSLCLHVLHCKCNGRELHGISISDRYTKLLVANTCHVIKWPILLNKTIIGQRFMSTVSPPPPQHECLWRERRLKCTLGGDFWIAWHFEVDMSLTGERCRMECNPYNAFIHRSRHVRCLYNICQQLHCFWNLFWYTVLIIKPTRCTISQIYFDIQFL